MGNLKSVPKERGVSPANMTKEETGDDFVFRTNRNQPQLERNWIIDSGTSYHKSKSGIYINRCRREDGTLRTAGSENPVIKKKGTHGKHGKVKLVPEI